MHMTWRGWTHWGGTPAGFCVHVDFVDALAFNISSRAAQSAPLARAVFSI